MSEESKGIQVTKAVSSGCFGCVGVFGLIIALVLSIAFFPIGIIFGIFCGAGAIGCLAMAGSISGKTVKCPNCNQKVFVSGSGLECSGCKTRFVIDIKTLNVEKILN